MNKQQYKKKEKNNERDIKTRSSKTKKTNGK